MVFKARCNLWKYFDNYIKGGYAVCRLCKQRMTNNRTYCLRQHLKKSHTIKSRIKNFFDNTLGEGFATCDECNKVKKYFMNHVEKDHNVLGDVENELFLLEKRTNQRNYVAVAQIQKQELSTIVIDDESTEDIPTLKNGERSNFESAHNRIFTSNIKRRLLRSPNSNRHKQIKPIKSLLGVRMEENLIKYAIWGLMIDEGVPPSLIGSKNMQALLNPICLAISKKEEQEFKIDEAESERVLFYMANKLNKDLSDDLHWRLLSLKIDMDVGAPDTLFCVSVSFVDKSTIQTRPLGIMDLKNDQQLTEKHILEVLHKYNIDCSQIIYACWDNTKPKYNKFVENSMYLQEIDNLETYPELKLGDIKVERYMCVIAQLCLMDIFKNQDIFQLFLNCRNFVKFINSESNKLYDILKQNNLNVPQLDSPWKWGSTYQMLHDLHEGRKFLENHNYSNTDNPDDQFENNTDLWNFVEAFCVSLKFIQKSILRYYSNEMHFGDWYAQWLKTKLGTVKLLQNIDKTNKYTGVISTQLFKSIETRTKTILSRGIFLSCLYLDPRFHHTLITLEKCKAIAYLKNLWSRFEIYNPAVKTVKLELGRIKTETIDLNDDDDAFLNAFLCQDTKELKCSVTSDVSEQIEKLKLPFKAVETNILLFWSGLKLLDPNIFSLSEICFGIPTTQDYNRNIFFHVYKKQKNSKLPPNMKHNLENIRLNSHLVKDAPDMFGSLHSSAF